MLEREEGLLKNKEGCYYTWCLNGWFSRIEAPCWLILISQRASFFFFFFFGAARRRMFKNMLQIKL